MDAPDLLERLQHDHGPLTRAVDQLRTLLDAKPDADTLSESWETFGDVSEYLRDELLEHFGREEEALFPFIVEALPDLNAQVLDLEAEHDSLCGAVSRLAHIAQRGQDVFEELFAQAQTTFARFETVYLLHAQKERDFLLAVARSLTPSQRVALDSTTRGLL